MKTKFNYFEKRQANTLWKVYADLKNEKENLLKAYSVANENIKKEWYKVAEQVEKRGKLTRTAFYRKNRLENMFYTFNKEVKALGGKEASYTSDILFKSGLKLKRLMGESDILFHYNQDLFTFLTNNSWKYGKFSDIIWKNKAKLMKGLRTTLSHGLITGKSSVEIANSLSKELGVSYKNALRLVRTEGAHHLNQANVFNMARRGVTHVREVVTIDERTSEQCSHHDGLIHRIENAPTLPRHPNCRCTLVAYFPKKVDSLLNKLYNIAARSTIIGKPAGVLLGYDLNARQKRTLKKLPDYDSRIKVKKNEVSMLDLATLTAHTDNEFAMFTRGRERLIIRGSKEHVNIGIEAAKELAKKGYKWSGHTHPGDGKSDLIPSEGDYEILKAFRQKSTVIYNSKGKYRVIHLENYSERGE